MSELSATAVRLADFGWHVFPLSPGSKKPLPGGRGQDEATTDVGRVLEWWTDFPDANIGIHCRPSGLYVIDLDRHAPGADGVQTWQHLRAAHGDTARTATVKTAGGGYHLYYRAPADVLLNNTAGKLGAGIDTRGNGYVVAPPSVVNGNRYERVSPPAPVLPLPPWVIDALKPRPRQAFTAPLRDVPKLGSPALDARLNQLRDELAHAPDGEGNHTAARLAYCVGQYVGAGQLDSSEAIQSLALGLNSWTWRRESDYQTMVRTIERQVLEGSKNPRPWT